MENPTTAPWGLRISNSDFEKLQVGFTPQNMDDRWECATDKPDQQGNTTVRLSRSWSGSVEFILAVKGGGDNGAEIAQITWNKDALTPTDAEAKEIASNICRNHMYCEWE